jgi:hypothetical protein
MISCLTAGSLASWQLAHYRELYQRAGWEQIGVASVAMPNGKSVAEYVFVGPAQPTSRSK